MTTSTELHHTHWYMVLHNKECGYTQYQLPGLPVPGSPLNTGIELTSYSHNCCIFTLVYTKIHACVFMKSFQYVNIVGCVGTDVYITTKIYTGMMMIMESKLKFTDTHLLTYSFLSHFTCIFYEKQINANIHHIFSSICILHLVAANHKIFCIPILNIFIFGRERADRILTI